MSICAFDSPEIYNLSFQQWPNVKSIRHTRSDRIALRPKLALCCNRSIPVPLRHIADMSVVRGIQTPPAEIPPHGTSAPIYLTLITCVAALGGLLFGYDTAVISGAIGLLQIHFHLTPAATGWAASSALAGCVLGASLAGFTSNVFGRHRLLVLSGICFLLSAIGTAASSGFQMFILFRILGGIGIGAASVISPLYIGESSPARWRGRLVAVNQLAIVFGMLVVYLVNYRIHLSGTELWNEISGWRWMFGSGMVPSILLLVLLFTVPETARFLLSKGRRSEAERVAARIGPDALNEILFAEQQPEVRSRHTPRILVLGISLAVLQQVTGINVFLYYAPSIFAQVTRSTNVALLQTVILGAVNLIFTVFAMVLVDRAGRKPLLICGSAGMAISLLSTGWAITHATSSLLLLILVLAYIACFAFSVGPVTWILLSEIFPSHLRAEAMAISTAALWIANFVVSQTFPMLSQSPAVIAHFGRGFPFYIYALFCFIEVWLVAQFIPETRNRSLEEITRWWSTETPR